MYRKIGILSIVLVIITGCETTNSIPYDPSTENVIILQNTLKKAGKKLI